MCQEIQLSDVRMALADYCEENEAYFDEHLEVDDLLEQLELDQLEESEEDAFVHAFEHKRRASELALAGDENGAAVHRSLMLNMKRVRK